MIQKALLITNLRARSTSHRVKQVIEKALSADLELEVAETAARNHATELARDAAERGFDLVIVFGGDGTMNEVVNGLIDSNTALAMLPGGLANVLCRCLGVPVDIVEATGYLLNRLKNGQTRKLNLGRVDDRYFVLSCGVGLDAATVRRVESDQGAKRKYGDWYFVSSALKTALGEYRGMDPYIQMDSGSGCEKVVAAIVSKAPQFTFFKGRPVIVAPGATLDGGLDVFALRRLPIAYVPRVTLSLFTGGRHVRYKQSIYHHDIAAVRFASEASHFPVQVDGEYVGERQAISVELIPNSLLVLA